MKETGGTTGIDRRSLARKTALKFGIGLLFVAAIIFVPAGSLRYPNGWLYLGVIVALLSTGLVYLYAKDPALLEKRLRSREKEPQQKRVIAASAFIFAALYALPGLDWRFGWSRMPAWLVAAGVVLAVAGYALFLLVLRANAFLSRVVELQEGQRVADSGPYAAVRHPMYSATLVIYLASPLILGSYWALIPAAAYALILVPRILNEEALLRRDLAGYPEYCEKVRWRLVPGIW